MIDLNLEPTSRQLRQFGAIAIIAFAFLGAVVLVRGGLFGVSFGAQATAAACILFAMAAISGTFSMIWPSGNRPLYVVLTLVAFPIGLVLSHVALALLFFAVLTPLALVFRLVGRDALNRRWEPERSSYWIDLPEISDKKYYFHQY